MTVCRECRVEIPPTGKRGRPPVLCPGCRVKKPAGHKRISPALSVESEGKSAGGVSALPGAPLDGPTPPASPHKFRPEDHPVAFRWCRICGRSKESHEAR